MEAGRWFPCTPDLAMFISTNAFYARLGLIRPLSYQERVQEF